MKWDFCLILEPVLVELGFMGDRELVVMRTATQPPHSPVTDNDHVLTTMEKWVRPGILGTVRILSGRS